MKFRAATTILLTTSACCAVSLPAAAGLHGIPLLENQRVTTSRALPETTIDDNTLNRFTNETRSHKAATNITLFDGSFIHLVYSNAFVFSPRRLTWTAYNSRGRAIKSGRASGGKGYCRDVRRPCRTPVGHFRVRSKGGPGCKSSKYPLGRGGAPMPYCTFFRGNYAIHGSYDLPRYNASHGCIRVSPASARWLSRNFLRVGTRVIVLPY